MNELVCQESDSVVAMNWVAFLGEDLDDVSCEESEYSPPSAVTGELEVESEDEELREYDMTTLEVDTSDEEFEMARKRLREYKAEMEKEDDGQLS